MQNRPLWTAHGLALQVLHHQVRTGFSHHREDFFGMRHARRDRDGVSGPGTQKETRRIHHGREVERPRRHGETLIGSRIDDAPVHLDAVLFKGLFQKPLLLHHDVLQIEGRLHVGDVDFLREVRGLRGKGEAARKKDGDELFLHLATPERMRSDLYGSICE